jgi:hypothetical protein
MSPSKRKERSIRGATGKGSPTVPPAGSNSSRVRVRLPARPSAAQPPVDPKNPPTGSQWQRDTGEIVRVLRTEYSRARWHVHYVHLHPDGAGTGAAAVKPRARFLREFAPKSPEAHPTQRPADEMLQGLLALADREVPLEVLRTWSRQQRKAALRWAGRVYLFASDNPVRVPPEPAHVQAFKPIRPQPPPAAPLREGENRAEVESLAAVLYEANAEEVRLDLDGISPVSWEQATVAIRNVYRKGAKAALRWFQEREPIPEDVQDPAPKQRELLRAARARACEALQLLGDIQDPPRTWPSSFRTAHGAISTVVGLLSEVLS